MIAMIALESTMQNWRRWLGLLAWALVLAVVVSGCAKKPPVPRVTPAPSPSTTVPEPPAPPAPPEPVTENTIVPPEPITSDELSTRSLDDLNRDSPLQPVFFAYDSAEISTDAQTSLSTNADLLKKYPGWKISIEGHCDERGTPEYNLALGERRALAAMEYLVSIGIAPDRLRTVSYGKEFPFDPGHDESAWSKNRRAHFVITAK
jgi:peptidoglycan-associated lipoprotein